jgi:hypothetical protein
MLNKKDALGNAIVFGSEYGWSNDSNGITTINIGVAVKQTPKGGITLNKVECKRALYMSEGKPYEHRGTANVKPIKLFPIAKELFNNLK